MVMNGLGVYYFLGGSAVFWAAYFLLDRFGVKSPIAIPLLVIGVLFTALDLRFRRSARVIDSEYGQTLGPRAGAHLSYIPVWIVGILLTGAAAYSLFS